MAAGIEEPPGDVAGRVTITGLAFGLIPPLFVILVVITIFLLGIIDSETAAAVILGVLVSSGLTSGTIYQKQKRTPTDQVRTVWGAPPMPMDDGSLHYVNPEDPSDQVVLGPVDNGVVNISEEDPTDDRVQRNLDG